MIEDIDNAALHKLVLASIQTLLANRVGRAMILKANALQKKGDGFMAVFLTVGAFAGIMLGLRFNVFVLVPTILLAVVVITLSDIANRQSIGVIVITALATVVLLQIGYLGGRILKVATKSHVAAALGMRYRDSNSQLT
jgi:hypothetical protein